MNRLREFALIGILAFVLLSEARAQNLESVPVEGQPLASNVSRVIQALDSLGTPLPVDLTCRLVDALKTQDATKIQELLDPHVLIVVNINPEARVKAQARTGNTGAPASGLHAHSPQNHQRSHDHKVAPHKKPTSIAYLWLRSGRRNQGGRYQRPLSQCRNVYR